MNTKFLRGDYRLRKRVKRGLRLWKFMHKAPSSRRAKLLKRAIDMVADNFVFRELFRAVNRDKSGKRIR